MNFQNGSILFKDVKSSLVNDLKVKQQIPECIIAIIYFFLVLILQALHGISDQFSIINKMKVRPGSNVFPVPLQMISFLYWTNTWRGSIWRSNTSRRNKWLIKQHHRNSSFLANYLEDNSQMQNASYQQDTCFKCFKYTQSFKRFDSKVEFTYFQHL